MDSTKTLRVMKLTACILLIGCLAVSARGVSQMITLNEKNTPLTKVFKEIEKQTDYQFLYFDNDLQQDKKVSINVNNANLPEVLQWCFRDQSLSYEIVDKTVVVKKKQSEYPKLPPVAPDGPIRGTINDAKTGLPIEGVTITVKGTTIATKTNSRGEFTLIAPDNSSSLVISSIGYISTEVPINSGSISVKLPPSATDLSEVVVVGYETMKKSDLTGAIATINADKLDKATAPDVSRMLQGKAAGLQILQNSAQPGGGLDILIRGGGSINASNRPLFVIDGFPIYETGQPEGTDPLRYYTEGSLGTLNSLNPNDIQTITVLKDASATAIYGSRAANGVVLITTKRGATGEAKISYSGNYSFQPYDNRWDLLPFKQWLQTHNEAGWENFLFQNQVQPWGSRTLEEAEANPVAGLYTPRFSQAFIDNADEGTDWLGLITRTGTIMQHNVSVSGGSEGVKYLLSGNYFKQNGVVKNSGIERGSFRSNVDIRLNKFMKLVTSLNWNKVTNQNSQLGDDQYEKSGVITAALQQGPHIRARDENGGYPINPDAAIEPNPASLLTMTDKGRQEKLLGDVALEINPVNHLMINVKGGIDKSTYKR